MPYLVEVRGDYALFCRPELSVARLSYDVIPPGAARAVLESVYRHPGIRWAVERVYVLSPIRFMSVRPDEAARSPDGAGQPDARDGTRAFPLAAAEPLVRRASLVLRDVHYVIKARFDVDKGAAPDEQPGNIRDIIRRRLEKRRFLSAPYLGCREFPATVTPWECDEVYARNLAREAHPGKQELGLMLYDTDCSDPENAAPVYFRARLLNGVMNVFGEEVYR